MTFRVSLRPLVATLALVACDVAPTDGPALADPLDVPLVTPGDAQSAAEKAEHAQYEADMAFYAARREAYERDGIIPTVPPSLSDDPHDPTYRFAGYMHVMTEEEQERFTEYFRGLDL